MVVIQDDKCGSGGNRTRVMIPGTTSEKYRETNVEIKEDFPTPSVSFIYFVFQKKCITGNRKEKKEQP
jgi:hypothetical protein